MFTRDDFRMIDKRYFDVVLKTVYYIDIKSKNTGHTWSIYSKQLDDRIRSLVIRHKHHDKDSFHIQLRYHPRNLLEAQDMIKAHDKWHLEGRKH